MKDVREMVVPGRLPGALVGLVGVVVSLPSLVLPIQKVRENRIEGADPGTPAFEQSFWSWGRFVDTTPGSSEGFDVGTATGLVLLVMALAVGLFGVLAYAFRRGADGRILGAVGFAWAASQVVGNIGRRLPDSLYGTFGTEQILIETQPAGVLEAVSAVLLVVALGIVLFRPLVALVRSAVTRAQELAPRGAAAEQESGASDAGDRPTPRVGIATIRDVEPGSGHGSRQPAGTQWGEAPSGVGFSDVRPDAAPGTGRKSGSDAGRFRPPR